MSDYQRGDAVVDEVDTKTWTGKNSGSYPYLTIKDKRFESDAPAFTAFLKGYAHKIMETRFGPAMSVKVSKQNMTDAQYEATVNGFKNLHEDMVQYVFDNRVTLLGGSAVVEYKTVDDIRRIVPEILKTQEIKMVKGSKTEFDLDENGNYQFHDPSIFMSIPSKKSDANASIKTINPDEFAIVGVAPDPVLLEAAIDKSMVTVAFEVSMIKNWKGKLIYTIKPIKVRMSKKASKPVQKASSIDFGEESEGEEEAPKREASPEPADDKKKKKTDKKATSIPSDDF